MTLLSPLGLLWLVSIPILCWIWRFTATQHRRQVPSLVPFERLLKRPPKRLTRLVVNTLFWLQLAALLGGALALAQPALVRPPSRTTLVVLDTSASMGAVSGSTSALERAKRALLRRVARKRPTEQLFLVATSPLSPLTPQPTSDAAALRRAIRDVPLSHLGGNLATTAHVGRGLLGAEPDETVIVTDEPVPAAGSGGPGPVPPEERVRWLSVGAALPNAAIVGLDAQGPLCDPSDARIVVTVQNFAREAQAAGLRVVQNGRRMAEERLELSPGERRSLSLPVPESVEGWVVIELDAARDALASDDRAWIRLERATRLPILLQLRTPSLQSAVSGWLAACPTLAWSAAPPDAGGAALVVTDEEAALSSAAAGMLFLPPSQPRPVLSYWTVSSGHPIGSYLAPVGIVGAPLNLASDAPPGFPVIVALVNGRKVPLVVAEERDGRRLVTMRFSPAGVETAPPVLLAFFNSLRWLLGAPGSQHAGESLMVPAFTSGMVSVRRPDGSTETMAAPDGGVRYDNATLAGLYRFRQAGVGSEVTVAVNAFDPLESNLLDRASTWRA
ncbi:MAG: VWA domain-containing protein, partial [Candidatus Omnitrophica bacterium]|nr:VWA domain-containing protein [Candidatus Omnitrophota bacterium]